MQMTMSYVWVTLVLGLLFVFLAWLLAAFVLSTFIGPFVYTGLAREAAQHYAYAASLQAQAAGLNPDATFLSAQPGSLTLPGRASATENDALIPYITPQHPQTQRLAFALLISPNGRVLASSYPQRYPPHTSVATLLPQKAHSIMDALAGTATSRADNGGSYAIETVWNHASQPIGAVYAQWPTAPSLLNLLELWQGQAALRAGVISTLLLLIIITPIGALFGLTTTRGLVRRIRRLVTAASVVAAGNYAQRVQLSRHDEIGTLEMQFNRMAAQLEEDITLQQKLTAQNARLAERERISRELHDAISQDLFSLRMLAGGLQSAIATGANLQPYIETLKQATDGMLRDMRALLLELRPLQLEELGLARALEELASTYSARLGINVTAEIQAITLSEQAQHTLFRIAQEALTNAIRHADATTITMTLRSSEDHIAFDIVDNGKGFAQTEEQPYGLGLHLMQERVHELRGEIIIRSAPGEGTRIAIHVPQEKI